MFQPVHKRRSFKNPARVNPLMLLTADTNIPSVYSFSISVILLLKTNFLCQMFLIFFRAKPHTLPLFGGYILTYSGVVEMKCMHTACVSLTRLRERKAACDHSLWFMMSTQRQWEALRLVLRPCASHQLHCGSI